MDRREEIWVLLAVYDETAFGKGIREGPVNIGGTFPAFTTDPENIKGLKTIARMIDRPSILAHFTNREDLETFEP